ncbi:LytR/AlgR family response regulator transcription factor [Kordia jejudonensis]|uniref:LytR/AlgR family response regulator transcription factor n=1 Tax=Kordia jejudonensis TaxID=1348245 RepID=UPI0006296315|nr:LytTR family DNA-binding domain-containing protein [Kordia jejudonensis]
MKTILIIDDEEDARNLLRQYISAYKELLIIGEASNGYEAVELINKLKPDTIFLDIQMPGFNGFEVLTHLKEIPEVIFSTAYDQYAIKAFEVHAIDYLLKPYGKKRFESALHRILKNQENVIPLAEELLQKEAHFPSKVILHKGTRKLMIPVKDLYYAEAFGDYTKVFTKNEEFLATKGISQLKNSFNPNTFIRLHRSHFVNINTIVELKKVDRYHYVYLTNGKQLRVSETYLPELKKLVV